MGLREILDKQKAEKAKANGPVSGNTGFSAEVLPVLRDPGAGSADLGAVGGVHNQVLPVVPPVSLKPQTLQEKMAALKGKKPNAVDNSGPAGGGPVVNSAPAIVAVEVPQKNIAAGTVERGTNPSGDGAHTAKPEPAADFSDENIRNLRQNLAYLEGNLEDGELVRQAVRTCMEQLRKNPYLRSHMIPRDFETIVIAFRSAYQYQALKKEEKDTRKNKKQLGRQELENLMGGGFEDIKF